MDSLQQSLPPVPARIKKRIIKDEYKDLTTLLPKAMLSSNVEPDHPGSLTLQLPLALVILQSNQLLRVERLHPSLPGWKHGMSTSQYKLISHHHAHLA